LPPGAHYRIVNSESSVEYWSSHRPSFFVKDWRAVAQRELATSVRALDAGPIGAISALYDSADRSLADAENVLIYNLWPFGLNRLATRTIRFERAFSDNPGAGATVPQAPYYSRYRVDPAGADFDAWRRGEALLTFTDVRLPSKMPTRCSPIWWAIKGSASLKAWLPGRRLEEFGVALKMRTPSAGAGIKPGVIKVLFDGAIAASAFDDTAMTRADLGHLAAQVGAPLDQVRARLGDEQMSPLGGLLMARRGGSGLQLSPPDDYCVAGELVVEVDPSLSQPVLTGKVFGVEARSGETSTAPGPSLGPR